MDVGNEDRTEQWMNEKDRGLAKLSTDKLGGGEKTDKYNGRC